jgi:hypothetical protein
MPELSIFHPNNSEIAFGQKILSLSVNSEEVKSISLGKEQNRLPVCRIPTCPKVCELKLSTNYNSLNKKHFIYFSAET